MHNNEQSGSDWGRRYGWMSVALGTLAVMACVRPVPYPAFDEYRAIRQGEPVSLVASSRDNIQSITTSSGILQALPLTVRIEPGVRWLPLSGNVFVTQRDASPRSVLRFVLLGRDTAVVRSRAAVVEPPESSVYLYPHVEQARIRAADLTWEAEEAAAHTARTALNAGADSQPASTIAAYRAAYPRWDPVRSAFYLVGLEAIADASGVTTVDVLLNERGWLGLPGRAVLRPEVVPGAVLLLREGFRNIDSVRVLGTWYPTTDLDLWRARPIRDLDVMRPAIDRARRTPTLNDFRVIAERGAEWLESEETLRLQLLDLARADTARVFVPDSARLLLVCWDSASPRRPCFNVGQRYDLTVATPRSGDAVRGLPTTYPFRVLRKSRMVAFVVGTGLILGFVALSPSGQ
jgi:hypothetical protein